MKVSKTTLASANQKVRRNGNGNGGFAYPPDQFQVGFHARE